MVEPRSFSAGLAMMRIQPIHECVRINTPIVIPRHSPWYGTQRDLLTIVMVMGEWYSHSVVS